MSSKGWLISSSVYRIIKKRGCVCVCVPGHSVQDKRMLYFSPHVNNTLWYKQINSPVRTAFHCFAQLTPVLNYLRIQDCKSNQATTVNQCVALWECSSWLLKTLRFACAALNSRVRGAGVHYSAPMLLHIFSPLSSVKSLTAQQRMCPHTSWHYSLTLLHYLNDEIMRINE